MEWIQNIAIAVIGLVGGLGVAGGVFAFISVLGILPRMVARLRLAAYLYQLETVIALGGITGNVVSIFQIHIQLGIVGATVIGFFSGAFVGALVMALAETLKVIPVLCHRVKLQIGLPVAIVALAVGKSLGSLYQLVLSGKW